MEGLRTRAGGWSRPPGVVISMANFLLDKDRGDFGELGMQDCLDFLRTPTMSMQHNP